jgi:hypothetical protein
LPFGKFCDASLCADKFKPGGINEHSCGTDSPTHRSHRSISALHHPGIFPGGNKQPAYDLSYYLFRGGGFRSRISPAFAEALCCVEVTRAFTTPRNSCGGNSRPECFAIALPLSYSSSRRWRDLNPHPVVRCNSHLRHAPNFSISGTPPAHAPQSVFRRQLQSLEEFRSGRNQPSRYIRGSNPSLAASADEVAVNIAIPGSTSPQVDSFGSK